MLDLKFEKEKKKIEPEAYPASSKKVLNWKEGDIINESNIAIDPIELTMYGSSQCVLRLV